MFYADNYNIPRKIRKLQCNPSDYNDISIITYQEKLGNYNNPSDYNGVTLIITYQEKLGNYNPHFQVKEFACIITYQEKLGNYNLMITE